MLKKILIILFIFFISINNTNAWFWLIAENWDLLSISKWNELITKLETKLEQANITWTWNIEVNNSWTWVIISLTWSIQSDTIPYITTTTKQIIKPSTTKTITIDWDNFTPNSTLQIPWFDWTINSINVLSPYKLEANITSWTTETDYDIVISNNWVLNTTWSWNWNLLLHVWTINWTWPSWTYTEDFESNSLWNWTEVSWLTANVSFQVDSWGTPSSNTWPNSWAWWSTYYAYTEASNPNYPNKTFAIETDYFHTAQSISFDYHMYWAAMWTLVVQTYYGWTWTDVYTISWQQQANQGDAYLNSWNIDLTPYDVEKIRFFYTSGNDYTWDLAVDNIVITSN